MARTPRKLASPARAPSTAERRVSRSASKADPQKAREITALLAAVEVDGDVISRAPKPAGGSLTQSLQIYAAVLSVFAACMGLLLSNAPPSPPACGGVSFGLLLNPSKESIVQLWKCSVAYQEKNWWFVLGFFELLYISLKAFVIPAAFSLCVIAGAIFPLPLAQLLTVSGECLGNGAAYLLSGAIGRPILDYLAPQKLALLRRHIDAEADNMYSFNLFLRFSPVLPNWFINVASPVVGNPLPAFCIGSLFGTQVSLAALAFSGSSLRTAGEQGFDLAAVRTMMVSLGGVMFVLQFAPIVFVYLKKKRQEEARRAAKARAKAKAK